MRDAESGMDTGADDDATIPPRRPFTGVQRQLFVFLAVLGVWFVSTALLALVSAAGGGATAQYLLGALVIVLIPVMLVQLFVLLRRALADERRAAPRSPPAVTRDDLRAAIARAFPGDDAAAILAALDTGTEAVPLYDRAEVQRAIVALSDGDHDRLRYLIEAAHHDYRDILAWADAAPES